MEKKATIATILVLSQALFLHAFPFLPPPTEAPEHNATEEGSGGSGGESNEENEDRSSSILLNDYVMRFFQQQRHLKERNCSTQFLGQSVSRHLCNSTNVNFRSPESKKPRLLLLHVLIYKQLILYSINLIATQSVQGLNTTQKRMSCAQVYRQLGRRLGSTSSSTCAHL